MCDCDQHRKKDWSVPSSESGVEFHIKRTETVIAGAIRKPGTEKGVSVDAEDSIPPVFWGARTWKILHDLAELTDTDTVGWQTLVSVLPGALPCAECERHMREWVSEHPIREVDGARQWMLAFHNAVNSRLGRCVWSVYELDTQYRGVDMIMMGLELREALEAISGILATEATCQMLRMITDVLGE